ncbi:LysR family transcriptional regulator [Romeria aff. gracilis LEGE 07310]|uniref:LysR family transcriptional regulator n=1 Tax=Vasconcelosia minhoensis LEGE 07310 TaxID=915328 RepID=A0A8J7AHS5_9CYAN|nr:LysR family transcriptional regulator [Romeria gracilis]MBE9077803.1 LysR family transcriptional regulator [Romeria aff. gracilis LEGE 07310]
MGNWHDFKIFLALAREGSARAAAEKLSVHHSTISRRIEALEIEYGVKLFDRLPSGYAITAVGTELMASAVQIEDEVNGIERQLLGKDSRLTGEIRVTLPDAFANNLLMPDIVAFMEQYPGIEAALIVSYELFDLTRREADVAIRVTKNPPDHLVGYKAARYACANYASLDYLENHDPQHQPKETRWIGWGDCVSYPDWVKKSEFPTVPTRGRMNNATVQLAAVKAGLGMSRIPCFMGDVEPDLRRVPPGKAELCHDVWILTHKDLRSAKRIQVFMEFMGNVFRRKQDLLEGRCPIT